MIIVTGAAGFIGSALVWELNQQGINDIICVDHLGTDERWKNLRKRDFAEFVIAKDLFDFLSAFETTSHIDAVYHLGACSDTTEKNGDFLLENNYYYSQALAEWCFTNNLSFVHASSGATYGLGEKGFDDQTPSTELIPLNPYGYSKVLVDRWLQREAADEKWLALKFFNVYGPNEYHKESMRSVVHKAFEQIRDAGNLKLFQSEHPEFADGEQMRDFVYVKDITRWMLEMNEKKSFQGIYNLGYGKARTWMDLAKAVFKNMNKELKIDWIEMPRDLAPQYQYFTEAKMEKAQRDGLSPAKFSLEEGVQDYLQNYLLTEDMYL